MPIFYFPCPTKEHDSARHSQAPNTAMHGLGGELVMAIVSETSESPWLHLVKSETHA